MTDRSEKLLRNVSAKQREQLETAIEQLKVGGDRGLDVRALKGYKNIFRARVGNYRIIFSRQNGIFKQIAIAKRDDRTYRDF